MATAIEELIQRQQWLETVDAGMQGVADVTLNGKGTVAQKIRNFLHGTWLGHPLHAAITDLPVGAWTTAAILDLREMLTSDIRLRRGTDAAVGIGLLGATAAAVSGLNDWQHTDGQSRRLGALHGLLNVGAASIYLASWLMRRRGTRTGGQILGLLGWSTVLASAYLGGKLVYDHKIGVDHSPRGELPDDFVPIMPEEHLGEGELHRIDLNGVDLLVVRRGDQIYALAATCAHLGGPLAEGHLEGETVRCPWHGSTFRLDTGEVVAGPSAFCQPALETRVRDGRIEVRRRRTLEAIETPREQRQPAEQT
ncbi:MAG: Rieske 2Fe-2S domain-containing protein [Thermoguttaceae bacterium]